MKHHTKRIVIMGLIVTAVAGIIIWSVMQANKNAQSFSLPTYNRDAQEIARDAQIIAIVQASSFKNIPEDLALTWRLTDVRIIKDYSADKNSHNSSLQIRQTSGIPADIKLDLKNTYLVFLEPYVRGGKTDGTYVIADAWNGIYKISAAGIECGYANDGSEIQTGKVTDMKIFYDAQIMAFAMENPAIFK